jgi:hypothetical protein
MKTKIIKLSDIVIDAGTQQRVTPTDSVICEYSEAIKCGAKFPPITVFSNGVNYYLVDGFHRYFAYKKAGGIDDISAEVHEGTKRDAILFSASVNGSHGLRLTNQDKRKHVLVLLTDNEWTEWSNRDIAKHCNVTHAFVNKLRDELEKQSTSGVETVSTSALKPASNRDDDQKLSTGKKLSTEQNTNNDNEPEYTELDKLRDDLSSTNDTIQHLAEENTKLRDALATGQLPEDEIVSAEQTIIDLRNRVKSLEAQLSAMTSSRDGFESKYEAEKKNSMYYQKLLKKMGAFGAKP